MGFPEITQILKREEEQTNFGGIWHTDTSYLEEPPTGTILRRHLMAETLFANQVAAHEALSDRLKQTLEGLRATNTSAKADASRTREDRIKDSDTTANDHSATHPVDRSRTNGSGMEPITRIATSSVVGCFYKLPPTLVQEGLMHTLVNVSFPFLQLSRNSLRLSTQSDVDALEGSSIPQISNVTLLQTEKSHGSKARRLGSRELLSSQPFLRDVNILRSQA
jgi:hypothetical protein